MRPLHHSSPPQGSIAPFAALPPENILHSIYYGNGSIPKSDPLPIILSVLAGGFIILIVVGIILWKCLTLTPPPSAAVNQAVLGVPVPIPMETWVSSRVEGNNETTG
ncbi:uncharacterized protein LOC127115759 [Lathyrus oleraceus]|uniref:uncharacterized protein LOC127114841 n=1 Tax=Pisum sativum TaxID=3888 RepID=UPI0021D2837E|nr:uncharacterized protein LOC127114841 [Pisum sativum]XP_050903179.1 uncharacterized protein LOC127115758 [Pisum sativum]XP_050903180.1 uncharacterized protein LOC127115759 [Pisum sativum]